MMRCDPISVTNAQFHSFFDESDLLGFKKFNLKFSYNRTTYYFGDKQVSLDNKNAFVWQILDEICEQLPYVNFWILRSYGYAEENNCRVYFPFTKEFFENRSDDNSD